MINASLILMIISTDVDLSQVISDQMTSVSQVISDQMTSVVVLLYLYHRMSIHHLLTNVLRPQTCHLNYKSTFIITVFVYGVGRGRLRGHRSLPPVFESRHDHI